jgi:hypothetical protein
VDLYKPQDAIKIPPSDTLAAFRALVVGARSAPRVHVSETTAARVQSDFVAARQTTENESEKMTGEDLIRMMTLAKWVRSLGVLKRTAHDRFPHRVYALSLNETELTVETWERTQALEASRKGRLA